MGGNQSAQRKPKATWKEPELDVHDMPQAGLGLFTVTVLDCGLMQVKEKTVHTSVTGLKMKAKKLNAE